MTVIATEAPRERKARGAFYTPLEAAQFLVDWAVTPTTRRILEPSSGDGVFLEAVALRVGRIRTRPEVVGVELVAAEAAIARQRAATRGIEPTMRVGDFFTFGADDLGTFDAVIGNPPWIRYHGFTGAQRSRGLSRASAVGVELGGLASSWAPYVAHACSLLADGGRLGLVLPAELLQVDYATDLRRFLAERFRSIRLIAFTSHVFGDAEVDAVLLLAGDDGTPGITFERVDSLADVGSAPVAVDPDARWTNSVAPKDALELLDAMERAGRLVRLGALGSVDIGVVTGHNNFFLVSEAEVEAFAIPSARLLPVVSRSDQLSDAVVTAEHFRKWRSAGRKSSLLALDRTEPKGVGRYLAEGERIGVPDRYKCRMRRPWYAVPLKAPPDLFVSYMAHQMPRMAWNQAGALSTNLIHGVYLRDAAKAAMIAANWTNPATALSAELEGRTYGGGVLKLETKEAERILVPNPAVEFVLGPAEIAVLEGALRVRRGQRLRKPRVGARAIAVANPSAGGLLG